MKDRISSKGTRRPPRFYKPSGGHVDGRTKAARLWNKTYKGLRRRMKGRVSAFQESELELATGLIIQLQCLNAAVARGEEIDVESQIAMAKLLKVWLKDLGLGPPPEKPKRRNWYR